MPPNTTDLKACDEVPDCGQALLAPEVKKVEITPPVSSDVRPNSNIILPQVLATCFQSLLLFALGMMVGALTVVIGALNKPNNHGIQLTDTQASWFAGLLLVTQPTGSVLSGVAQDILGRKRCMLLVNIPQLAGWLLIRYATSVEHLFMAALLMGFTIGFMEAPTLSYVGEIAQPRIRGVLTSFTSVYISSGLLCIYLMASFTDWRTSAALSTAVPVITVIAISQVPESPVWLILKGREMDAERALRWLRGWTTPENVAKELAALKDHLNSTRVVYAKIPTHTTDEKVPETQDKPTLKEKLKYLSSPAMIRPLFLTVMFFGFAHAAALNGSRPYLKRIYETLGVPVDPFIATVCSAITQILGSFMCMVTVRLLGKRRLSLISMAACSVILLLLATYTLMHENGHLNAPWMSWTPLVLMCVLTFATNSGIGVVPWTLLAEVFPTRGRGIGGGVAAASFYLWFFMYSKTWLDLQNVISLSGMFYFYSFIGFLGFMFLYFCLPETEGKSLEEVEHMFQKKEMSGNK